MDGIEKLKRNDFNQTAANHLNTYITFLKTAAKFPFTCTQKKNQKP